MRCMPDLRIEIVYALPHAPTVVHVAVARGATVQEALERSGLLRQLGVETVHAYGIFGRRVAAEHRLADGDRIEIYRPLQADPRAARRKRATQARRTRR